ncbi:uncharacterized protein MJAP1_004259 [Malassezia japonica]|uniref:Cysteine-rich PDZ-binding protein n=1 Tax=Malassezia japonica TaxID=223818 RepID=A0AAF0JBW3_9BASI|nr:uncharacterized protein MJAP1_004259 [Malassezia japonica]WFD41262.1 hypothetical protein MJAP1_004259 [Malassezia japonica]
MVCAKCEKTLSKTATTDPFRNRNAAGFLVPSGSAARPGTARGVGVPAPGGRKVGENKLLSKSARFSPLDAKCKLCKQRVSQERAAYCQACAYKKGLCAICGKQILDTSRYKQSS